MSTEVFSVESKIRVVSYGPFGGLRGTIIMVDTIAHLEEPFCFYLVALEGAQMKEPVWFEHDEMELVTPL